MKLYLAGPMTGITDFNFQAFNFAAAEWRAKGWEVYNPAEEFNGDTGRSYREYVAHDLDHIFACHAMAMLTGWDGENARGSVWEEAIARRFGLVVYKAENPVAPPSLDNERETILQEAQRLVHGARGSDYGHPIVDYKATGRMWGAILERHWGSETPDVDPRICCLMMAAVKLSREAGKHKRDNNTDTAGYAECAQMIAERQGL